MNTSPPSGTSCMLLATDGADDFKEGRRHLWKQRKTDSDNRNIKATQIIHAKLIGLLWCIHYFSFCHLRRQIQLLWSAIYLYFKDSGYISCFRMSTLSWCLRTAGIILNLLNYCLTKALQEIEVRHQEHAHRYFWRNKTHQNCHSFEIS